MKVPRDPTLGLDQKIDRRDFLNGLALSTGALMLSPRALLGLAADEFAPEKASGYYPPALTGLRGSTKGSYEAAHLLKDGFFEKTPPFDTGESYDLVVVGAGISGLAAAHFFRQAGGKGAKILILDNHDDFGGHARRNEFNDGDRLLISYGGTLAIDSPAPYSAVAKGLISDLGIEVSHWEKVLERDAYAGLGQATFFDRETFGQDKLVKGLGRGFWAPSTRKGPDPAALAEAPLGDAAKRDILRLETEGFDPWPGVASSEKKARLLRMTYADFLTRVWSLDAGILPYYQRRPHGLFGVGIDAVSGLDAWGLGFPGFDGLHLEPGDLRGMNRDAMRSDEAEEYFFHYPDGNATVARLLVRRLIPAAMPGTTADDVVLARADYAKLDEASSPVRLRLNSTVIQAQNMGAPASARGVEITYVRGGKLFKVRAQSCVMACWNAMIPYLCPEMSETQRDALAFAIKVPLVYTSVLVRNWSAFRKLGLSGISCPGSYWSSVRLDTPVSVGGYHCQRDPEGPIVVNLSRVPCEPGLRARDQHRAGRQELLDTPFEEMEGKTRDQMARVLGAGGFDAARDIRAITVNRWPHGYAYQYNALFDPFWVEGGELPCLVARRPFGRIFSANSDADAYAYTDCAIDQAHRAVTEVLTVRG
jgi:spermidine dehydrogenase